jgi:hypothetical protein
MHLRNYVYMSKAKLDIYYPQIATGIKAETSAKTSVNLGVVKAEVGGKLTAAAESDHNRLEATIKYLQSEQQIGTPLEPKTFFAATMSARSLIHGNMVFFGGSVPNASTKACIVGLTCSLKHMIGYGYDKLNNYSEMGIGPTQSEHFVATSSSLGFARTLRTVWAKEEGFELVAFDPDEELRRRRERYELTAEERSLVERSGFLNGAIETLHPSNFVSLREMFIAPIFDPVLRVWFGKEVYKEKTDALEKLRRFRELDVQKQLSAEEAELLDAVRAATRNIDAPPQKYEFVALTLLSGTVRDEEVVLGSPL